MRVPGRTTPAGRQKAIDSCAGYCVRRRRLPPGPTAAICKSIFKRFVVRLGYVKAIWAIAHRMAKIIWNVLRRGARFTEFSEASNPKAVQRAINHHLKARRRLGYPIPQTTDQGPQAVAVAEA